MITAAVIRGDEYSLKLLALEASAKKVGFGTDEIASLAGAGKEDLLRSFRDVLLGRSEIRPIEHLIDLNATLFIPQGSSIHPKDQIESRMRGLLKWDPSQVSLFRSRKQRGSGYIEGVNLKRELEGELVLPATALDFLLKSPHLIPEEWKEKTNGNTTLIFFWGTIYRDSGGDACVRCLCWDGGRWGWVFSWLENDWYGHYPAAVARK